MSSTPGMGKFQSALALLVLLLSSAGTSAEVAPAHAIKAAIVHKITKFVSWPDGALGDADSPIRFCVAGDPLIHEALQKFERHPVQGRPLTALMINDPSEALRRCDVLYLSDSSAVSSEAWFAKIATEPILTFGESGDASIVKVSIRRKKVRFSINLEASEQAGIDIGAQLLQLAALSDRRGG